MRIWSQGCQYQQMEWNAVCNEITAYMWLYDVINVLKYMQHHCVYIIIILIALSITCYYKSECSLSGCVHVGLAINE